MLTHNASVVEYDTPLVLLQDPASHLSLLVAETSPAEQRRLRGMARARALHEIGSIDV